MGVSAGDETEWRERPDIAKLFGVARLRRTSFGSGGDDHIQFLGLCQFNSSLYCAMMATCCFFILVPNAIDGAAFPSRRRRAYRDRAREMDRSARILQR